MSTAAESNAAEVAELYDDFSEFHARINDNNREPRVPHDEPAVADVGRDP